MQLFRRLLLSYFPDSLAKDSFNPASMFISFISAKDFFTIIEQWSKDFTVWNAGDLLWIENIVRWAKQDAEFNWKINWKDLYKSDYNSNLVQSYPNIILTEVMWIENPKVWTEIDVNSVWHGVITKIEKDSDWYDSYVVEFNDPKTYSELSYSIKVVNIEKN